MIDKGAQAVEGVGGGQEAAALARVQRSEVSELGAETETELESGTEEEVSEPTAEEVEALQAERHKNLEFEGSFDDFVEFVETNAEEQANLLIRLGDRDAHRILRNMESAFNGMRIQLDHAMRGMRQRNEERSAEKSEVHQPDAQEVAALQAEKAEPVNFSGDFSDLIGSAQKQVDKQLRLLVKLGDSEAYSKLWSLELDFGGVRAVFLRSNDIVVDKLERQSERRRQQLAKEKEKEKGQ